MRDSKTSINPNQPISTDVHLNSNEPVHVYSRSHGDEINGVAFNIRYLEKHNPAVAERVRQLADEISNLSPNEPPAHEEDLLMIADEFEKIAIEARGYPR